MPSDTPLVPRSRPFASTIFSEMTALALTHDAANLGQGFPDHDPPEHVLAAAHAALDGGRNQYAPGPGLAPLRRAVADHQHRFHGLTYDPDDEVTVTFGATEAIAATVLALCQPGDEVVLIDPSYDAYPAAVAMAGARAVRVAMTPPELTGVDVATAVAGDDPSTRWHLDVDRVAAAVTDRTRAIVVNTPHNPTGSVLDVATLDALAAVCVANDLVAITDEVYEHLVHDGTHVPLATRPGMRDRTVTVSSAGKTFACTGWKIGWACAPPPLTAAVRATKQFLSFAGGTPLQFAIATALASHDQVYADAAARNADGHRVLGGALTDAEIPYVPGAATYYVTIDARTLGWDDGDAFCRWAPANLGVAAVPVAAFTERPDATTRALLRLATCKGADVLEQGVQRLAGARELTAG